ncbi:hypothetical protein AAMO2058_001751800 [Amorphochlora amoebiformis]
MAKKNRRQKKKAAQQKAKAAEVDGSNSAKGKKAFVLGDYKRALQLFTEAIKEDAKDHALYSNRAATHYQMQSYQEALADANKCIELKPNWHKGYLRQGMAYEKLLQFPEAKKSYDKGIAFAPDDPTLKKQIKQIEELLDELKISEQESAADNPDGDRFTRLIKWMKDGGCKFPKLYMKYYTEDYRGVHTLCHIPADDMVLYVPQKYIMTTEMAKESAIGKSIRRSRYEIRSAHSWLAVYLCQEKHNLKSFWKPYIDILPDKYSNMPIFFEEFYKKFLKGSYSLEMASNRKIDLRSEYEGICSQCAEFRKYHQLEFVWGRLVVITRNFGLDIHGNETDALVPYADMLNHMPDKQTDWKFDNKLDGFTMVTNRSVGRGEQIFDSYGRKCQGRYFVNYGFTIDNNFNDNDAVIIADLPKDDKHFVMKLQYLRGRREREFQVPGHYSEDSTGQSDNNHPRNMFSFFRFLHARDKELMVLSTNEGYKLKDIDPISIRNEIAVLKHIQRKAKETLARFPDPLTLDHKLLKQNKFMDMNHRNAIMMRAGEKETLHWFITLADRAIPMLEMNWKDLKREAAKCQQKRTRFNYYVTAVIVPLVKNQK